MSAPEPSGAGGLLQPVINDVMVRVVRRPVGTVDGVSLAQYRPGHVYDVQASSLAEYLIIQGFAVAEMRRGQRSHRRRETDRRRPAIDGALSQIKGVSF